MLPGSIDAGRSKWPLRAILEKYVPRELTDRPKIGFSIPIDQWLRGELRDWAESLLSEKSLREGGILNPVPVRQAWQEHLAGARNLQYPLWCVLMLQAWLEQASELGT